MIPAGCTPMIFTFDDGTKGQFSLVEKDGKLVAEEKSAVGIMEKFNKEHPDFGMKGTFYKPWEPTLKEVAHLLRD